MEALPPGTYTFSVKATVAEKKSDGINEAK